MSDRKGEAWKNILLAVLGLALAVALWHEELLAFVLGAVRFWRAHPALLVWGLVAVVLALLGRAIATDAPAALREIKDFFARHGYSTYLLLALPAAAVAVYYTFTSVWLQGLSGFAAAAANICLFVAAYALFDKLPFRRVDTYAEIKAGNLAVAVYSSAIALGMALLIMAATS